MTEEGTTVRVRLPRALLVYSRGDETVEAEGSTLKEVLAHLDEEFPGLRERIVDDQGQIRRFVHVFINGDSMAFQEPGTVRLRPGDTVHVLPSVAGGFHD